MARTAQEALGYAAGVIAIGDSRAPVWPAHLCGSISHARSYCACFVQDASLGHVGVDIYLVAQNQTLEAVLRMVVSPSERAVLESGPLPLNVGATPLFLTKETLSPPGKHLAAKRISVNIFQDSQPV